MFECHNMQHFLTDSLKALDNPHGARIQHHKIKVSKTTMAQVVPNKLVHHPERSGLWQYTF
jgi:hypothetical protein